MKAMIIMVNKRWDADALTLKECGFKLGDIVEFSQIFPGGVTYAASPRHTESIAKGEFVSIERVEYVVVES